MRTEDLTHQWRNGMHAPTSLGVLREDADGELHMHPFLVPRSDEQSHGTMAEMRCLRVQRRSRIWLDSGGHASACAVQSAYVGGDLKAVT